MSKRSLSRYHPGRSFGSYNFVRKKCWRPAGVSACARSTMFSKLPNDLYVSLTRTKSADYLRVVIQKPALSPVQLDGHNHKPIGSKVSAMTNCTCCYVHIGDSSVRIPNHGQTEPMAEAVKTKFCEKTKGKNWQDTQEDVDTKDKNAHRQLHRYAIRFSCFPQTTRVAAENDANANFTTGVSNDGSQRATESYFQLL